MDRIPEVQFGVWVPLTWKPRMQWLHHTKAFTIGELICTSPGKGALGLWLLVETGLDADRGSRGFEGLQLLWEAGLRAPSRYRVPRPYCWDPVTGVQVRAYIPGRTWADEVLRDVVLAPEASEWAAGWLGALQRTEVPEGSHWSPPTETPDDPHWPPRGSAERILRRGAALAAAVDRAPDRRALRRVAEAVAARLDPPAGLSLVLSHGDFHPKNLLLAGPTAVGIDIDQLSLREPAADVGCALAQLLSMSLARTGSTSAGAIAGQRFWTAYHGGAGEAGWDRVAAHAAATLVECIHYCSCAKHGQWPGTPWQWTRQVEQWLHSDGPQIMAELDRHPWQISRN